MRLLMLLAGRLVVLYLLLVAMPAVAAPGADDIKERMDQAVEAQRAGRHEVAVGLFEALTRDFPKGRDKIAFYMARSLLALERYDDARTVYRQLAEAQGLDDEKRVEVRKNQALCDEALRTTAVRVTLSGADKADLFVDGKPSGRAPRTLDLRKGTYRLSAEQAGFTRVEREVVITGQPALDVDLPLARIVVEKKPEQTAIALSVAGATAEPRSAGSQQRTWAWVALGTGGAALAGGAGLLGNYFAKKAKVAEGEMLRNQGVDLGVGGTLAAVGVGLVTTSMVLFFTGDANRASAVGLMPVEGGATVAISGSW